jgi:hypothetical protein
MYQEKASLSRMYSLLVASIAIPSSHDAPGAVG